MDTVYHFVCQISKWIFNSIITTNTVHPPFSCECTQIILSEGKHLCKHLCK